MRKVRIVTLVGLSTFSMGGIVFGFSSLYPILYKEGVFANRCNEECGADASCCGSQRLWLSAMASASLFAADGVMVIYGEINDHYGAVPCLVIGAGMVLLGLQVIAIAVSLQQFINVSFFVGLMAMGLGGPGIFMGCLGFGALDATIEPFVTAVAAASWDSSSIVFLVFAMLYSSHSFGPILGLWTLAGIVLTILTTWQLIAFQRSSVVEPDDTLNEPLLVTESEDETEVPALKKQPGSLRRLLVRGDTLRLLTFMSLYNLKSAFYIESISDQIRAALNISARSARHLDLTFNLAFPIGGFATSLASAAVLEKNSDDIVFLLVALIANLFSLIQLVPHEFAQYTAALLFGPARTLQWAAYFHFLMTRYPANDSGRLIGYGNLVIAIIGDGLPYALTAYVNNTTLPGSKSSKYTIVHTVLALLILFASVLTYFYFRRQQQRKQQDYDPSLPVNSTNNLVSSQSQPPSHSLATTDDTAARLTSVSSISTATQSPRR